MLGGFGQALRADCQHAEAIGHALAEKFERWPALDARTSTVPSRGRASRRWPVTAPGELRRPEFSAPV